MTREKQDNESPVKNSKYDTVLDLKSITGNCSSGTEYGSVALPINDIPFEEQRPYPGSVQDNCKHVHHGQFHSADTLEPARRTPDDPVDCIILPYLLTERQNSRSSQNGMSSNPPA